MSRFQEIADQAADEIVKLYQSGVPVSTERHVTVGIILAAMRSGALEERIEDAAVARGKALEERSAG